MSSSVSSVREGSSTRDRSSDPSTSGSEGSLEGSREPEGSLEESSEPEPSRLLASSWTGTWRLEPSLKVTHQLSSLEGAQLGQIRSLFRLPASCTLISPPLNHSVVELDDRGFYVYEMAFRCGLRFPLDPDVLAILRHIDQPISRYVPNAWRLIVAFLSLLRDQSIPFDLRLFQYFLRPIPNLSGDPFDWITLSVRNGLKLKNPSHTKAWKHEFFLLSCDPPLALPRQWKPLDPSLKIIPKLSEEELATVECLKGDKDNKISTIPFGLVESLEAHNLCGSRAEGVEGMHDFVVYYFSAFDWLLTRFSLDLQG